MKPFDTERLSNAYTAYLPIPAKLEPHLEGALHHVLRNPGNLIRPQIAFQMSVAYDLPDAHATELAIALEYFHTASLLFDDLPCMDHAIERRGRQCVHVCFGESGAILAALAFINRAYALTWRAVSTCPPQRQRQALTYLEQQLGVEGLLNGQSLDLHYSTLAHNRQTTEQIASGKTVSLIRLAIVLPALLGGASEFELRLFDRIALYWGLSYQILDDLKDMLQCTAETGKTDSRDDALDRPNIALAIGIPAAVTRLARLINLGERTLGRLLIAKPGVSFLHKLCNDLQKEAITRNAGEKQTRELA
jgi:geranylgeranyl pyrophosphate synthase